MHGCGPLGLHHGIVKFSWRHPPGCHDFLIQRFLLATRPEVVTQLLGIVYRAISDHLNRKAGSTRASTVARAATLIQRFGSALNLNVHFHLLVVDGDYRAIGLAV